MTADAKSIARSIHAKLANLVLAARDAAGEKAILYLDFKFGGVPTRDTSTSILHERGLNPFWTMHGVRQWPRDPVGYVFLGRALDRLGASEFGKEWSLGDKTLSSLAFRFGTADLRPNGENTGLARAAHLLRPARRNELLKSLNTHAVAGVKRVRTIEDRIIRLGELGRLKAHHRPVSGGEFDPISPATWQGPNAARMFDNCELMPVDGSQFASAHHVFVEERSLQAVLDPSTPAIGTEPESFKAWVADEATRESRWTVAYKTFQNLQREHGRFAGVSRTMFDTEYRRHFRIRRSGPAGKRREN